MDRIIIGVVFAVIVFYVLFWIADIIWKSFERKDEDEIEVLRMNGYKIMAECYKKLMNKGKIDKEKAEKEIRIYEFLATCDKDDLCRMADSSAFNDIIIAFLKMAVENADIDEKSQEKIKNQLRWIFDEKSAKEVLQYAKENKE